MRVLVFGGRDFNEIALVHDELDRLHRENPITCIIHGGAPGADSCANLWALNNGVQVEAYPADWRGFGKSAGPRRNQIMLEAGMPDLAIGFPGGRGTADMKRRVLREGIELVEPTSSVPSPVGAPHAE